MNTGEIIYEQGNYKIQFYKNDTGQTFIDGVLVNVKSYHFRLLKYDMPFKYYTGAIPYPKYNQNDIDKIKSACIDVLKKFIL